MCFRHESFAFSNNGLTARPNELASTLRLERGRSANGGTHRPDMCLFFIELVDEVKEGDTQTVDEWVLRSLRRADDPAVPVGPDWVREAGLDVTALGSPVVLLLC